MKNAPPSFGQKVKNMNFDYLKQIHPATPQEQMKKAQTAK